MHEGAGGDRSVTQVEPTLGPGGDPDDEAARKRGSPDAEAVLLGGDPLQLAQVRDGVPVVRAELDDYFRRYFPPAEPGRVYEGNLDALGRRFDESAGMTFDEWSSVFDPKRADGTEVPPDGLPLARALELFYQPPRPGPGIDAEILPRIFDAFITSKHTGTGLGLTITHDILEQHHGRISADNDPQGGAIFSVWLPMAEKEQR